MRTVVALTAAALVVALVVLTLAPAPPVAEPSPSATEAAAATPSVGASPSASPTPAARRAITVIPVSAVPSDHRYTFGWGRVLLLDLEARRAREVVRLDDLAQSPDQVVDAMSASRDGKTLVLLFSVTPERRAIVLVRPVTGETRTLVEGPDLEGPLLSDDGARLAFARRSDDAARSGIWVLDVTAAGAAAGRLVAGEPGRGGPPASPLSWSPDGRSLVVRVGPADGPLVAIVDAAAGETRFDAGGPGFAGGRAVVVGPGSGARWRDGPLLTWTTVRVAAYDVASGATRVLYEPPAGRRIVGAAARPGSSEYAVVERELAAGPGSPIAISLRGGAAGPRLLAENGFIGADLWWSADGAHLYTTVGGDDSTGAVRDLIGQGGMPYCLRGGEPPSCT